MFWPYFGIKNTSTVQQLAQHLQQKKQNPLHLTNRLPESPVNKQLFRYQGGAKVMT